MGGKSSNDDGRRKPRNLEVTSSSTGTNVSSAISFYLGGIMSSLSYVLHSRPNEFKKLVTDFIR